MRLRPTIDKVIKKFELIHAFICNLDETSSIMRPQSSVPINLENGIKTNAEMYDSLDIVSKITQTDTIDSYYKLDWTS